MPDEIVAAVWTAAACILYCCAGIFSRRRHTAAAGAVKIAARRGALRRAVLFHSIQNSTS